MAQAQSAKRHSAFECDDSDWSQLFPLKRFKGLLRVGEASLRSGDCGEGSSVYRVSSELDVKSWVTSIIH